MAEGECWATTASNTEEAVKALVLAKGLRRLMTARQLLVVASPQLPDDIWDLLQIEFDVVVRLERKWLGNPSVGAKVMLWGLTKWRTIVHLAPDTMVVRPCDEIFKEKSAYAPHLGVIVLKPSATTWLKLVDCFANGNEKNGEKLILEVVGPQLGQLDGKYCVNVDVNDGLLACNLNELLIARFVGEHPIEVICKGQMGSVKGILESALVKLWKDNLDHGVAQKLANLEAIHFNGLKSYLDQYRKTNELLDIYFDSTEHLRELKDSIAVVGISCRFPAANNLDEFWKLLIEGKDAIRHAPEGRWTLEKCPVLAEESKNSRAGFLNCSIDEFDGKFFGVSPMEGEYMDPQQRLTLQVAWEALEDAGINPASLRCTHTGVFGGQWRTDYREAMQTAGTGEAEFFRSYLGNTFGVLTARISHCLGLTGPSVATESGCSSSIVAVDLACKSLLRRETNLALACGVNLLIHPFTGKTMNTVLAPDGHCKTFDESADGFGRAEGCGVLVLKRYGDAVRDGDRVWGLIRGSAVVQEGASRSLGTPTKYCEALAMKLALEEAKVEAKDVSYVETHGTGTPVGDPLEVAAVAEVYSVGRVEPLTIGSVKTNIGHTESCSGIAGIIKVILSMQHGVIPQHRNFTSLNPLINLDTIPANIPLQPMEWKRDPTGKKPRIAGVSSFGITGTDAHAIVQETPQIDHPVLLKIKENNKEVEVSPRPHHILVISGKNEEALEDNLKQFEGFLRNTEERLADIAHTANIGRGHFQHRAFLTGKDNLEVANKIKNGNDVLKKATVENTQNGICFLFTGQGSQYPGMAKALYQQNVVFRMHFDQCDRVLMEDYDINIKDALWGENQANLSRTIYSQTSIFCVEYCLLQLWNSWGVKPSYVMGHSLGEFGAAVAAGILSFADALKLVAERSRLIDALPRGKMLVLKENKERTDSLIKTAFEGSKRWLDYAAVNSPEQTVVAGTEENVLYFAEFCKNNQVKVHVLDATHAFHSRLMDPMLEEYRAVAETVVYSKPRNDCVYISGMEGRIIEEEEGIHVNADYWVQHTRDSVRFSKAAKDIMSRGCNLYLEVGPQPVLSALTMINSDGVEGLTEGVVCLPSLRKQEEDWSCILTTLGKLHLQGVPIDWKGVDQYEDLQICTAPFYPFQNKRYWFNIPDRGPGKIHPLVGTPMSNASSIKLYQNQLELEDAEFLKDHVIGNKIIFPGAGFMEMCLVAGHAATTCTDTNYFSPVGPVTLIDFAIDSPLGIVDNEVTPLQAIVSSEDSGDTKVTIYSKLSLDKETQKWIRHASATFSPFAVQSKEEEVSLNLPELLEAFKVEKEIAKVYGSLAEFGLKFGPTFQTLKKLLTKDSTGNNGEVLYEVDVTQQPGKFVCHPVVMDAMFQAIMISSNPEADKLHVPVSVQKFISFGPIPADTQTCYIYCKKVENGDIRATLLDTEGTIIAQMDGGMLVETTVATIMSALESQRLSLPDMYEDVWRTQMGPMEKRADLSQTFNFKEIFDPKTGQDLHEKLYEMSDEEKNFHKKSNRLCALYMINAIYGLSSGPVPVGTQIVIKDFVTKYKVLPGLVGFVRYMFFELEKDGYFKAVNLDKNELSFKLIKELPKQETMKSEIDQAYKVAHPMSPNEVDYVSSIASILASVLTGNESALPYIFPDDPSLVSAEAYYRTVKMANKGHALILDSCEILFKEAHKLLEENKQVIRILEVGAGTGSFTKTILPLLQKYPAHWEFSYTDLSQMFFAKGQQVFENSRIKVLYKILNIEEDIATQGFIPGHYDIIMANNVVHATKSIPRTVRNLRNLLRENGVLVISESARPYRPTVLTFGLLDAYWHYEEEDFDLRGFNCEITEDKWHKVMSEAGYEQVTEFTSYAGYAAVIIGRNNGTEYKIGRNVEEVKTRKVWWLFAEESTANVTSYVHKYLESIGNQVVVITKSENFQKVDNFEYSIRPEEEGDMKLVLKGTKESGYELEGVVFLWGLNTDQQDTSVVQPYLHLCKSIITLDHPKLFVITKSILSIGDHEVSEPFSSPLFAMTKCFQNEQHHATTRCIDLDDTPVINEEQLREACSEFLVEDHETYVAYRSHQRHIPRFIPWKPQNTALPFPKSEKYRLLLPASRMINDLKFGAVTAKTTLGEGEVECRVKSYALNFRDVFVVMKPIAQFEELNTVGIDWSGVVTSIGPGVAKLKVGDPVFGINLNGDSLPSHLVRKEDLLIKLPDQMTFNEAATIPAVAATAYLCLVEVAKLTKNDTILIHAASGGVGLVAIQIAKSVGARIIATAGNKRKRAYLRSLGIQHIFNSRNTEYEHQVRSALGGSGVDVVLNSLTSEGFKEASLSLCNKGARFVEMSKLGTWSVQEVKQIRPDVDYTIVDLSASTDDEIRDLFRSVTSYMKEDVIRPIPYSRFDASEIRDAMNYLQKAKHIGKIVLTMPDPDNDGVIPMFSDRSTYLITGGLGGIGMEVAKWMVQVGAKNVALVGRNPPNEKAQEEIRRMNQTGNNVFALQYDVGKEEECKQLLEKLRSEELGLPPLRGVMHAAGVLSDSVFANQSWEKFCQTYNPKVKGGWNLHKMTINYPLEHFVMFSSAVASLGSIGQSNHASANFFLDSLAQYRHFIGLPATTINWGQWGQVGVAANMEIIGLRPFSVLQGISALEKAMKRQRLQSCVCDADFSIISQVFSGNKKYLGELKFTNKCEATKELVINNEQLWNDYDNAKDDEERVEVLRRFVRCMIRQILKLGKDDTFSDDENFQDLGMDSLMMIEVKNVVQSAMGKRATISVNSVKGCNTVNQLATRLWQLISGNSDQDVPSPTRDELRQLILEDSILPESIKPAPIPPCKPSEVRCVLMTGVTGNMGPYFLQAVSQLPHVEKVYCIIRNDADNMNDVNKKLERRLNLKGLMNKVDMSKVEVIVGHVTKPNFGLDEPTYTRLAEEVDAVIHNAVKSNFVDEYKKIDRPDANDIRTVNVKGTLNILEFLVSHKTKLLLHPSSIVANAAVSEDFRLSEEWPKDNEFEQMPNHAYPISKYVCDRLMARAVLERGLPIKVFRFPAVGGDSASGGNVDYDNNQLMLRMMSYIHLRMMPAVPIPFFILPVDVCVDLSLRIFFNDQTPSDMYNIYNPYPHNETELVLIGEELGYKIDILEPDDFHARLAEKEDSKLIHFLKEASGNKDALDRFAKDSPAVLTAYTRNPSHAFFSKKLQKLLPDYPQCIENTLSIIKRDLENAKNSGIFQKFGID